MKFLFDLGGVFFDWDPEYFYKDIIKNKLERDYFLKNVCNNSWNSMQDKGRLISEAEKDLSNKYPEYEDEIKMFYKNHRKMFKKVFKKSINILKYLKKNNYNCYVLSNWSSETYIGMEESYPFLKLFNGKIISGDIKLIKPDYKIYKLAIKKFKLIPKETIFIDDRIENIYSAQKLNFKTIHLSDPNLIEKKIKQFLL